jgi:hypothetical protein
VVTKAENRRKKRFFLKRNKAFNWPLGDSVSREAGTVKSDPSHAALYSSYARRRSTAAVEANVGEKAITKTRPRGM